MSVEDKPLAKNSLNFNKMGRDWETSKKNKKYSKSIDVDLLVNASMQILLLLFKVTK